MSWEALMQGIQSGRAGASDAFGQAMTLAQLRRALAADARDEEAFGLDQQFRKQRLTGLMNDDEFQQQVRPLELALKGQNLEANTLDMDRVREQLEGMRQQRGTSAEERQALEAQLSARRMGNRQMLGWLKDQGEEVPVSPDVFDAAGVDTQEQWLRPIFERTGKRRDLDDAKQRAQLVRAEEQRAQAERMTQTITAMRKIGMTDKEITEYQLRYLMQDGKIGGADARDILDGEYDDPAPRPMSLDDQAELRDAREEAAHARKQADEFQSLLDKEATLRGSPPEGDLAQELNRREMLAYAAFDRARKLERDINSRRVRTPAADPSRAAPNGDASAMDRNPRVPAVLQAIQDLGPGATREQIRQRVLEIGGGGR
jgi:hypothetical protein